MPDDERPLGPSATSPAQLASGGAEQGSPQEAASLVRPELATEAAERPRRQQHAPRSHAIHARVRSFSRAGGRLTESQHAAMAEFGEHYVVEVPRNDAIRTVDPSWRLDPAEVFGHAGRVASTAAAASDAAEAAASDAAEAAASEAGAASPAASVRPLLVEVGSGGGEAILAHAAAHPEMDHLAVEVWETAIAKIVRDAAKAGLDNVRVVPADASQLLATALPESSVTEVWTFFPDPWRKARHRKRRLVSETFAQAVARVLVPGGTWRLATDWADYAWQMRDVLEAVSEARIPAASLFTFPDAGARPELGSDTWVEGDLGNGVDPGSPSGIKGGWSERFAGRVLTRFEQRGIEEGRTIRDLTAVRTEVPYRTDVE